MPKPFQECGYQMELKLFEVGCFLECAISQF
jgi:hypothetical protein